MFTYFSLCSYSMNEYFTSVVAVFCCFVRICIIFLRKLNATFSRNQFLFIHFRCFFVGSHSCIQSQAPWWYSTDFYKCMRKNSHCELNWNIDVVFNQQHTARSQTKPHYLNGQMSFIQRHYHFRLQFSKTHNIEACGMYSFIVINFSNCTCTPYSGCAGVTRI